MTIGGATRITGIIGYPVSHSLSPAMQNKAFQAGGINIVYVPFLVRPDDLASAVDGVRSLGLLGINVTIPHKERVIPFLDWVSPEVSFTGAVNTIVNRQGRLLGYNTDVYGFFQSVKERGIFLKGKEAVLIGAGGAARAVVMALEKLGCKRILIFNRSKKRVNKLMDDLGLRSKADLRSFSLGELRSATRLQNAQIVVNATPIGLKGERFVPLNYGATPKGCLFLDLIYHNTGTTSFLQAAAKARRPSQNGLSMLIHQGARSFELWTKKKPRLEVMQRALKGIL